MSAVSTNISRYLVRVQLSLYEILTYDLNFVCSVNLPCPIGHPAGVSATVLWHQVPESQSPLLLTTLANLLLCQRPVVLQPRDVRSGIPTGRALEPDRATYRTFYHPLPHLRRLCEARTHFGRRQIHLFTFQLKCPC